MTSVTREVTAWIRRHRVDLAARTEPEQVRLLHQLARTIFDEQAGTEHVRAAEALILDLDELDAPLDRPGVLLASVLHGAGLPTAALAGQGQDPRRAALAGLAATLLARGVVGGGVPAKPPLLLTIAGLAGARKRWRALTSP